MVLTRHSGCSSFVVSREQLVRKVDEMVAGWRAYQQHSDVATDSWQTGLLVVVLYPRKLEKHG